VAQDKEDTSITQSFRERDRMTDKLQARFASVGNPRAVELSRIATGLEQEYKRNPPPRKRPAGIKRRRQSYSRV
jgi:hypothetical protein